jgi:hypothetical protein
MYVPSCSESAHARTCLRQAQIQYLRTDAERLMQGTFTEDIGRVSFSSVAQATLLAARTTYDAAPASRLAQKYF